MELLLVWISYTLAATPILLVICRLHQQRRIDAGENALGFFPNATEQTTGRAHARASASSHAFPFSLSPTWGLRDLGDLESP